MNKVVEKWATPTGVIVVGIGALGVLAFYIWLQYRNAGGAKQLAEDVVTGVADAAAGIATGAFDGVSRAVGISTTETTIDNVDQVREIIGQSGYLEASKRATASAFFKASFKGPAYYGNEGRGSAQVLVDMNSGSPT